MHERARAEALVADARQAVKEEAPLDRVRSLTTDLQQIFHGLGASRPEDGQSSSAERDELSRRRRRHRRRLHGVLTGGDQPGDPAGDSDGGRERRRATGRAHEPVNDHR